MTFRLDSAVKPKSFKLDHGNDLIAVSCPTTSRCTAVDRHGNEITFRPAHPKKDDFPIAVDPPNQLNDVVCNAQTGFFCVAVDDVGQIVNWDYDPSGFSTLLNHDRQTVDPGRVLNGVACPLGMVKCTAVDDNGNEVTFPRGGFDPHSPPAPVAIDPGTHLLDVACPTASRCTAVGDQPPTPQQFMQGGFNGGTRVTFNPATPGTPNPVQANPVLSHVVCPSTSQCTAIGGIAMGEDFLALTFDPKSSSSSSAYVFPTGRSERGDVVCTSADQCVTINDAGDAYVGLPISATTKPVKPAATRTTATLHGIVGSTGTAVTWRFQFGTSPVYNNHTPPRNLSAGKRTASVSWHLTHLRPNTVYHFRLVATTGGGGSHLTTYGQDLTFLTKPNGKLLLLARKLKVAGGFATVRLKCQSRHRCRGQLSITTKARVGMPKKLRTVGCGMTIASIKPHTVLRTKANISSTCKSLLRHAQKHQLNARLSFRPPTGQLGIGEPVVLTL